jgi:homoserine trans-succinylase
MPSSIKGLQLLNLMPNLQQLEITVHNVVANVPVDFKLQLGELKHLNGENENLSRFLRPESLGFSRGNVRDLRSSSR